MPKRTINKVTTAGKTATLEKVFQLFITDRVFKGRAEITINNYVRSYNMWLEYNGYDGTEDPMTAINKASIYTFISKCSEKSLSNYSINHYLIDIRAFFRFAFANSFAPEFEVSLVRTQEVEPKYYTDDEVEKLLEKPKDADDYVEVRTWVIVNFICATGARSGTICNVKVKDVDFKSNLITYRHTKNKKFQTVPITPALAPVLRKYIDEWRPNEDEYLFVSITEQQLNKDSLGTAFNKYCKNRGVEPRGVHQLRHSFAHHAAASGMDVYRLQIALGHSNVGQAEHYAHMWGQDLVTGFSDFTILDNINSSSTRKKTIKKK